MSTLRGFRRQFGQSDELTQLQSNVEQALQPILRSPIINGTLIESVSIGTSATQVAHKLGRKPLGYFVAAQFGPGEIWAADFSVSYISFTASTPVTVNLWVF